CSLLTASASAPPSARGVILQNRWTTFQPVEGTRGSGMASGYPGAPGGRPGEDPAVTGVRARPARAGRGRRRVGPRGGVRAGSGPLDGDDRVIVGHLRPR